MRIKRKTHTLYLRMSHGIWWKCMRVLVLAWRLWRKRQPRCFSVLFASFSRFLYTPSFFIVAFDTNSHFCKSCSGAADAIEVDFAGVCTVGTDLATPSAPKAWVNSIIFSSSLVAAVDRWDGVYDKRGLKSHLQCFEGLVVDFSSWYDLGGEDFVARL